MRSRSENRILNVMLIAFLSMLVPMILATRVFQSTSYLALLYMIGYTIQIVSMILVFLASPIKVNRNSLWMLVAYVIILILPLINDLIQGISINYYDPINSLIKVINFVFFYILMEKTEINSDGLFRFMCFFVILSVVACVYSIVFEFNEILSIRNISNTNSLKISSFFSNRNQYGIFLVMGLIANLYSYQLKKQKISIYVFVLQIACILSTFSRAALFSAIIIIGMMVLQTNSLKRNIIIISILGTVGIIVLFTTGIGDYFIKNYIRLEQSGDSGRFSLWMYAWDIAKINLITGVGFYTGVDLAISNGMGLTQFHNMFFDLLVDGGILEVLFVVALFCTIYRHCARKCANKRILSVYRASLVAFIFYSCFESASVLALSYADTMFDIFYISLPLLLANMGQDNSNQVAELPNSGN